MKRIRILGITTVVVALIVVVAMATPVGQIAIKGSVNLVSARLGIEPNMERARRRLEARLGSLPDPGQTRICVSKSERTATVLVGEIVIAAYPIALGGSPQGQKLREGDGRTPEGTYRICTRLDRSRYHLLLGLSYPGPEDARRAIAEGTITQRTFDAVAEAEANSGVPPWDSVLGGAVGLHGGGTGMDWTLGRIAFENDACEEIWLLTQIGTKVEIGA